MHRLEQFHVADLDDKLEKQFILMNGICDLTLLHEHNNEWLTYTNTGKMDNNLLFVTFTSIYHYIETVSIEETITLLMLFSTFKPNIELSLTHKQILYELYRFSMRFRCNNSEIPIEYFNRYSYVIDNDPYGITKLLKSVIIHLDHKMYKKDVNVWVDKTIYTLHFMSKYLLSLIMRRTAIDKRLIEIHNTRFNTIDRYIRSEVKKNNFIN